MKALNLITGTLLVVGGLNWGLVGASDIDLVAGLFGEMSLVSRTVYTLVGVAALYQALTWRSNRAERPAAVRA